ncbi:MAG: hypothetical protein IJ023_08815 [Bacteroidales bacterium]|nr:hypothetical protein [Bacteroidales bacterium]
MKREELYESPQMEVLELHTEGVLCASGDDIDVPGFNKGGNLDDLFN